MLRMPQLLFFATVQPVLFVVGLSVVFGPLVESMLHQGYIEYLLPGVLVMNLILASGSTGIRLAEDMKAGIIDRFRSLPMSRVAVLAARTLGDLIRNTAAAVCIVVSGYAVGYRLPGPVLGGLAAVALSLFFAYATTWLFAAIGLAVKDPQTAQFAGFAPVLPLVFLSGAWVPVATMSHSIQGFARHQPVNVTIDAVRSLAGGHVNSGAVVQSLLWSVGLIVVFGALSVRQYQRAS
jgi:ABC-2 type transport system permease protein/oleandomycin transport system permease protein